MGRQLHRSKTNKVIAGVCGGLGEYFGIEPTLIRLIWAVICLPFIPALIAYIVAAIVIPEGTGAGTAGSTRQPPQNADEFSNWDEEAAKWKEPAVEWKDPTRTGSDRTGVFIGGILIVLGGAFLAKEFFHWFNFRYFWPLVFIGIGALIIYKGWRKSV